MQINAGCRFCLLSLSMVIYPKRHDAVCTSDLTTPLLGDGCLKP
jgi:hypothetical protein